MPDTKPSSQRPVKRRRLVWYLAILIALALVAVINRNWLASLPNARARDYLADRQAEKALWWLGLSKRFAPGKAETEFLLARARRKQGQFDEARQHLARARQLGWAVELVEREEWLVRAQSGDLLEALSQLSEMLKAPGHDGPEICEAYVMGFMEARNGMRSAYELLSVWSTMHPQDPQPHFLLARLSTEVQDWVRGEKELRRALEIDPHHYRSAYALGDLLLARQQPQEALQYFQRAAAGEAERPAALVGQAHCLRLLGSADGARQVLAPVLADDPQHVEANLAMARLELDAGQAEAALERLNAASQREPRHHDVRYALAEALRAVGRLDEARQQFQLAAEAKSQLSRAIQLTQQLLAEPQNLDLRYQIGQIHLKHGKESEALSWLMSILRLQPQHRPTLETLAQHYESKADASGESRKLAQQYRRQLESL